MVAPDPSEAVGNIIDGTLGVGRIRSTAKSGKVRHIHRRNAVGEELFVYGEYVGIVRAKKTRALCSALGAIEKVSGVYRDVDLVETSNADDALEFKAPSGGVQWTPKSFMGTLKNVSDKPARFVVVEIK